MRIEIQLRIVADDNSVISEDEILHLDKGDDRLEVIGLSFDEAKAALAGGHRSLIAGRGSEAVCRRQAQTSSSDEALDAPGQDGNEGDLAEGDEVLLRSLEDRVQPPVIRNPGKGALHHPAGSGREELAITAAGDGLDGNAELPARLG